VLSERTWDQPSLSKGTRPRSLSAFVQGFKGAVTARVLREGLWRESPVWQRGFYDHMIRKERALAVIRRYVEMNPALWGRDVENVGRER